MQKVQRQPKRTRWAKQKQAKMKDFVAKSLYLEGELNVQQYNFTFARNGCRFTSTSSKPAMQLFRTSLKTIKGIYKGAQATNFFAYLPLGFLIFFSYHACLHKPSTDPMQRYHQVQVGKCDYLVDTESCTPYGLENFVKCAIQASSTKVKKYSDSLRATIGQKKHVPNCDYSIGNYRIVRIIRIRYPFYYKVTQRIFPGEELCTHPNYGGEHFYPDNDIVC